MKSEMRLRCERSWISRYRLAGLRDRRLASAGAIPGLNSERETRNSERTLDLGTCPAEARGNWSGAPADLSRRSLAKADDLQTARSVGQLGRDCELWSGEFRVVLRISSVKATSECTPLHGNARLKDSTIDMRTSAFRFPPLQTSARLRKPPKDPCPMAHGSHHQSRLASLAF
jgi:hypothetical protein